MSNKVYMIRRRKDGLYSTGGNYPKFKTAGKMWDTIGKLNAHLTTLYGGYSGCLEGETVNLEKYLALSERQNPYLDCDIVEAQLAFDVKEDVFRHMATRYLDKKKK